MASILVIGVGSTGLAVMERAQQFYYELTKKNSPGKNSAFMFLETDGNRCPEVTPNGKTDIKSCYLCPENINATLANWNESKRWDWLPTTAQVLNTHSGAAGQPAYGRVALWGKENAVRQQIAMLYSQIGGDRDTNIYVVGSLTGGTGTGIFLDLAYMIRQCTNNNNIYGMFLLPNAQEVGQSTKDMIYENSYSSLRAIDKFSKADVKTNKNFQCILPGGTDISNLAAPFYNVQFFTQDFCDATASLTSLSQLVYSVGFNLVLRMLDVTNSRAPFQDLINARLVDYTSSVPDGIFTTIGMNVFQYPESLLEEYLTTKLLEENFLQRWADTTNYLDPHGTPSAIETVKTRLKLDAQRFVHETLEEAIIKSEGGQMLGKSTFESALNGEIEIVLSGNYQAPSVDNYIFSLFDANSQAPKFYAAITGQATNLRDYLIKAIAEKIEAISTQYQNLQIIYLFMEETAKALGTVMKDWARRYKVDGTPNQWNKCWQSQFSERLSGKVLYALCGCIKEWYQEALGGIAKLCYYSAFMPMIENVIDAMLNKNGQSSIQTAAGLNLPTIKDWNKINAKVAKLLDGQDNTSLVARKDSIFGQMTNNSNNQINFLFNLGSCSEDVQAAFGRYQSQTERLTLTHITHDSLWTFLLNNDAIATKSKMISGGLSFIQGLTLFANTDVVQIMKHLPDNHPLYNKVSHVLTAMPAVIKHDVPAMAHLIGTEQFTDHNCLKLIVASPLADTTANGIVAEMQNFKPSANASDYAQLPSLKNTVVIYQEYGYLGLLDGKHKAFNPLLHLSYQPQVLEAIKTKIKNGTYEESIRLAYLTKEELIDTTNVKIK